MKKTILFLTLTVLLCFKGMAQTSQVSSSKSSAKKSSIRKSGKKGNAGMAEFEKKRVHLPNGWSLTPVGSSIPLGDLPLNIVFSASKNLLAVTNNGQSVQSIQLIDARRHKLLSEVVIPKSWYGLAFSADERTLYASGGNDNRILKYSIDAHQLKLTDTLTLGNTWPGDKICPTGIYIDDAHSKLYTVTKEDNSLYVFDLNTKKILQKVQLGSEAYTCAMRPGTSDLYISLWGSHSIAVFNTMTGMLTDSIEVGSHPGEFVFDKKGLYLFCSNANDNSASIVDLRKKHEIERLSSAVFPTALPGTTPNGLTLSEDEKTLYIANADNNCLAVFDVSQPGTSHSEGFIPTGWYPSNVKVSGKNIFVSNGKGFRSMANPLGPNPLGKKSEEARHAGSHAPEQYIGGLFKGTLSIIPVPSSKLLTQYSQAVYRNTPFRPAEEKTAAGLKGNPIPSLVGSSASPIKYVFYIIKENRTYDQVLGDMKEGNGDSSLCIFPDRITPNLHAIAREFVLLDNFYVDAEVSADGHNWSMAAYANDFVEKTWPTSYGGRGGSYDYEGTRNIAHPDKGFIWDHAHADHISFRTYGEFAAWGSVSIPVLKDHACVKYPGFNLSILDVDKEKIWEHDFDSLLNAGTLPHLNTIRLGNDHTSGMRRGAYSVLAALADNDKSVGDLLEHLSHSKIWKESVVMVLEDDAQNGSDHVDAHRSPAYLAGPFVKRHFTDHTMYSTSGMLRTLELILGMHPMSQYDAAATPMFRAFSNSPDLRPFEARTEQIDIHTKNTAWNGSARQSEHFNLAKEDEVPDLELNKVIWKAVKGENAEMPAPRRSAFVKVKVSSNEKEDKD